MASEIEITDTEIEELVAAGEYIMRKQLNARCSRTTEIVACHLIIGGLQFFKDGHLSDTSQQHLDVWATDLETLGRQK